MSEENNAEQLWKNLLAGLKKTGIDPDECASDQLSNFEPDDIIGMGKYGGSEALIGEGRYPVVFYAKTDNGVFAITRTNDEDEDCKARIVFSVSEITKDAMDEEITRARMLKRGNATFRTIPPTYISMVVDEADDAGLLLKESKPAANKLGKAAAGIFVEGIEANFDREEPVPPQGTRPPLPPQRGPHK